MRLSVLADKCGCFRVGEGGDPEITMISSDSRKVRPGCLFIAVQGYKETGLKYIHHAVQKHASAVVVEHSYKNQLDPDLKVPVCYTDNARRCVLFASRAFYGFPSRSFQLIGVTGTNGKTTITYMIEAFLKQAGKTPGVIGTVSYRYGKVVQTAGNTTPDPVDTQGLFSSMKNAGVSHVIMEVSSHALSMDRVFPADFDCAVFTNLSQDHLDFHSSMEEYFQAKSRLFTGLSEGAVAVINTDDPYGKKLYQMTGVNKVSFGMKGKADYTARSSSMDINGSVFTINGQQFSSRLPGEHNIYNILAAFCVAGQLGIESDAVTRGLDELKSIPGRMERVSEGKGFHVFVDYAHTPDALDHLLDAARALGYGRIITVFGCGGDRDRGKRPIMGRIVEEKSDIAVVTSDNPRTEAPMDIINDIRKGLRRNSHLVVPSRREAIFRAVKMASTNDVVLIAGKGHEDYQVLGEKKIHFDDREVARQAIRELGK
ncbi:MAG: UDP-N-acetylmuramoyl-L-alanyl-D-glutamate--2,6-diaminopimelate ligase [Spirochaetota bacterium]